MVGNAAASDFALAVGAEEEDEPPPQAARQSTNAPLPRRHDFIIPFIVVPLR
jgi:hypothetical protein